VLRVLVQGLDAAERDEVGEVGHGEKRGEEKQAKHTPRKGNRKSFKEEKWIIFSRPLLSLFFLRNSSTPKRKGGASCCPSPFSLLRDSTRARKTKRVS
jgi:hypothetical protein